MSRKRHKAADRRVQQPAPNQKAYDAFANAMARTGFGTPSLLEGTQYPLTRLSFDYTLLQSLYRSHWIVRRIIDTVPEDCCKNWIQLKTQVNPDMLDRLNKLKRKAMVKARLIEGMKWGRLFGGAGAIMMIEGHESIMDQPLDYDTIMPGAFCGLLIRDRWSGLSPGPDLITNPRDPEYGLPEKYLVTTADGKTFTVHHSRLLRFIGRDVPFWEKQAESYWGVSEVEHIYDELKKRDNTSWNIANLIFRAYLITLKMKDLEQTLAIGDAQAKKDLYNIVQAQNWLMSNQGMLMMGADDAMDTKSYTFAGLSDIYDKFCLDISGAAEIPVTKLFGRSPAGMNATGESDMQNYDDKISQTQEADLAPVLDKLLPVLCMSEWGYIPDDLDYTFNPNRSMSNKDKADFADKSSETIGKAYERGLIGRKTALKEYRQQSDVTGIFSNITDEDIDAADNELFNEGEGMSALPDLTQLQGLDADFSEEDHPRDKDGRFAGGGGNAKKDGEESGQSSIIYSRIEEELRAQNLLNTSERVLKPKPIKIVGASRHAENRLKERGVTLVDAQHYVDTSLVMVQQSKDKFAYLASDGFSYVLEAGKLVSIVPQSHFDSEAKLKLGVIKKWLKIK